MISQLQRKILAFPYTHYDALICDGAIRSGKTSIEVVAFVDWAMRCFQNCRFGICGKTVGSAVKNIIVPYISMTYANQRYRIRWRRSENELEITNGEGKKNIFEVFGGRDEASFMLIQGRTLAGVLLDEVALMPESFVNQALARCSVEGAKLWFSCNPSYPQHWFHTGWIQKAKERNCLYLHFRMEDNPSLSEKTLERYKSMYSGVFYQRYILGEWTQAEGLVYPQFEKEKHCFSDHGADGLWYLSLDYGTINPTAMLLWRIQDGIGWLEKEYYHNSRESNQQKTDEEYYSDLENFVEGIPLREIIVDPSAASFKETIRRHGRFRVRDADNTVLDGIRFTGTMLTDGKVRIHESCRNTINEFGAYMWDDKVGEDRVIKENDHAMDAMRYMFFTLRKRYFTDKERAMPFYL